MPTSMAAARNSDEQENVNFEALLTASVSREKKAAKFEEVKVSNPTPKRSRITYDDNPVLNQTLMKISNDFGLSLKDLKLRRSVFHHVKELIMQSGLTCKITLFGSSLTGAGLIGSNIDICLEDATANDMLKALSQIQENDSFVEIKDSLHKLPPRFSFKDQKSGLNCTISCETEAALETSRMIQNYISMDRKVLILAQCFRFWAKICQIDRKNEGTLTPYCFTLMLIHFLQKSKLLPVLKDITILKWKRQNDDTLSQLWLGLLSYYKSVLKKEDFVVNLETLCEMSKRSKKWYGHIFSIADPNIPWKNVAHSLSKKVLDHFKSCFSVSLNYFGKQMPIEGRKPRCSTMTTSESEIEIESMESTIDDYDSDDENEVDDDLSEDFFPKDAEISSFISSDEVNLTKSESESSDSDVIIEDDGTCLIDLDGPDESSSNVVSQGYQNNSQMLIESLEDLKLVDFSENAATATDNAATATDNASTAADNASEATPKQHSKSNSNSGACVEDDKLYAFARKNLCKNTIPIFCGSCKCLGHRKNNCPKEKINIEAFNIVSQNTYKILGDICDVALSENEPTAQELNIRFELVNKLQKYIRKDYPGAKLSLFGSSSNGLGFRNSDMDICMVLEGKSTEDIDMSFLINSLGKLLKRCNFLSDIIVIKHAKVPIVKFNFKATSNSKPIEADISLYNLLALENTKLLLTYCRIDDRVRKLGYAIKYFAKQCEICDASRGTLSSYAHIVMLIHFLQQRKPAVLPVLQEVWPFDGARPRKIVDGCDSWFFSHCNDMAKFWPDFGKNKEEVGQLWLDFFRYYVEEFDFEKYVVSIRQSKPLRKFEKSWNRFDMCIEDPFKLEHNLAAGISNKVFKYIFRIFINARKLYSRQVDKDFIRSLDVKQMIDHFFDNGFLTKDLRMPQDRLCKKCGKIGHTKRQCTMKQTTDRKNDRAEKPSAKKTKDRVQRDHTGPDGREGSAAGKLSGNQPGIANAKSLPAPLKVGGGSKRRNGDNLKELNVNANVRQGKEEPTSLTDDLLKFERIDAEKPLKDIEKYIDTKDDSSKDVKTRPRTASNRSTEKSKAKKIQNGQHQGESGKADKDDIIMKLAELMQKAKEILPSEDKNKIEQMKDEILILENKFSHSTIEKKITKDALSEARHASSESRSCDNSARPREIETNRKASKAKEIGPSDVGKTEKMKKKKKQQKSHFEEQPIVVNNEELHNMDIDVDGDEVDDDVNEMNIGQNGNEIENGNVKKKNKKKKKQHKNNNPIDTGKQDDVRVSASNEASENAAEAATAGNAPKVVKTNMTRLKSNNEFLSLLTLNPVLDFQKGKVSKDDGDIFRKKQEMKGGSHSRDNGVARGASRGRGGNQRGRGGSRGGRNDSAVYKQKEDTPEGQRKPDAAFRGTGRGQRRGRGRGRGNARGQ